MGQVANVALTDTFDTWRVRSNQSFTNLFEINPTANTVSANTVTGATLVATSTVTVPAASISAVDVAFLANTNSRIGTVESATTTAAIQATAALANTNSRIGTVESATTTAAIQATAALANTNSRIGTVESATTTAAIQATAALANTNSAIAGKQDADADTAKTDVVQTFSVAQRGAVTDHGSLIANTAFRQDFSLSNHFKMTLAGNITLNNPTNQVAGQSGAMEIINGGSYTVSFGSDFDFAAGTPPTITESGTDVLSYYVSSANNIVVDVIQNLS
jgi:hypothetical protein